MHQTGKKKRLKNEKEKIKIRSGKIWRVDSNPHPPNRLGTKINTSIH